MPYIDEQQFKKLGDGIDLMRDGLEIMSQITIAPAPESPLADRDVGYDSDADDDMMTEFDLHAAPAPRQIPWGLQADKEHPDFIEGLLWIESKIGLKPEYLLACMKFESDINPRARNPASSASGLIQFMAATAKQLGTNIERVRTMDAMGQLSLTYKYFANLREDWTDLSLSDVYMGILWPVGIGKPNDYVLWRTGNGAYTVNKGLDLNRDGAVTKKEACAKVQKLYEQGFEPGNVFYLM